MLNTFLGQKLHMTQVYDREGRIYPATFIQAGPCWITQVKTSQKDGYQAIQIGYGTKKRSPRPLARHFQKAGLEHLPRFIHEVKLTTKQLPDQIKPGTQINLADFTVAGDLLAITGVSKGRGFTGVVKRHAFSGGPKTHGQSDRHRAPGAIGAGTTPGRVYKGKRMAGRSGGQQTTVKGLLVLAIDLEHHQLLVKGAVPGHRHSLLILTKTGHKDHFSGLRPVQPATDSLPAADQYPSESSSSPTPTENQPNDTTSAQVVSPNS